MLGLPAAFPNQPLYERSQVSNQQQYRQTWSAARARCLQSQAQSQILGIAKRLFDAHALRIQADNRIRTQMAQPQAAREQPRLAGAACVLFATAALAFDAVDVALVSSLVGAFAQHRTHRHWVGASISTHAQVANLRAGLSIQITRRNPGSVLAELQAITPTNPTHELPTLCIDHLE